jgi:hypothetical protein
MISSELEALPAGRAIAEVRNALSSAGAPIPIDAAALAEGPRDLIRGLPEWIGRFGFLQGDGTLIVWAEPRPGPEGPFPSQIIFDVPPGRYFVETLDIRAGEWISRESTEGGPLVAGVPFTGGAVLILIRPCPGRP